MTATTDAHYEPDRAGRLLRAERDLLVPLLRAAPDDAYAVRTCCPGWTVRQLLAHCGSALMRVVEGRFEEGVYSPESNERDIAERADWSNSRVVDELERGMTEAGAAMAAAKGRLDGVALGEWVHAGDVREAWGKPGAYGGPGLVDALPLLEQFSRGAHAASSLHLHADVDGTDEPLTLGVADGKRPPARYIGDAPVLIRLISGRPLTGTRYELAGATEKELILFG
ncbi:maleylpyruvate isomerase family mycothiol-dependent enzyme [Streptomyces kanamyceticus]|uniref:Maleylpyruvate isomerase family mycothiol-dependent enzyme n=1 Tax=Streptomyces kanamyceticus TaxID=1967 RepID=A0A5J6GIA5_STRKN|nr:maleylpyruvate isomerase family mycothiol-dependent enzyme [Streptomyces kanamyceticus]QEU93568.1 maleylpyruvate isomerase family mycothiol-dependent enzyme [Streptomyces kanamyceticus]